MDRSNKPYDRSNNATEGDKEHIDRSNTPNDRSNIQEEKAVQGSGKPDKGKQIELVYPPPPFFQRLKKQQLDKQFDRFLEVFKKLAINIPFIEALENMPSYAKFLKDILSKRRFGDYETVAMTEECNAIIQRKLPPKLKDPGSFTIPVVIGE